MASHGQSIVNEGQDDQMEIQGYSRSVGRTVLTWIAIILTVGFLRLVFYWKPNWYIRCTHCRDGLSTATHVLLKDQYDQEFVETVRLLSYNQDAAESKLFDASLSASKERGSDVTPLSMLKDGSERVYQAISDDTSPDGVIKYFVNKKITYFFSASVCSFEKQSGVEQSKPCSFFYDSIPLTNAEAARRAVVYGKNMLEVHVTSVIHLVFRQVINPFYVFQIFSCTLWYTDDYEYYASAILAISVLSIALTTYSTRQMERALKSTVHQFGSATVRRQNGTQVVLPTELVPGDIIELPRTAFIMDVDAVLLTGNCIVNESMLTGESIPVTKTPLPNPQHITMIYDPKHHAKHTLFCGTNVIQTRFYGEQAVTAMVIRTGFMTAKGGLIRSIMFPKPVDFKFYRDTYYFMLSLAAVAFMGMIFTLILMVQRKYEAGLIVRRVLDLITIAVPPALPAALAVGIVVSQRRLKSNAKIYCIMPSYINIAGSINVVCFDKTGTLTEDGLDMQGALLSRNGSFIEFTRDTENIADDAPIKAAMSSCHSLTYIDGELSGDPLDVKMFEATGWDLEEVGEETNRYDIIMPTVVKPKGGNKAGNPEVGILRQFTFSSALQRMSVIVKNLASPTFELYAKGSPEMISSLCKEETIPADFATRLAEYTQHGYRVIALAHRELTLSYAKLQKIDRSEVENELTFLGLLVMENRLKPETTPVINELTVSNIRTVMVTGDNMLTAVSVARECGIVRQRQKVILVTVHEMNGQSSVEFHGEQSLGEGNDMVKESTSIDIDVADHGADNMCFALTGRAWHVVRQHHPELLERIAVKGAVFARMSPEQKAQLVEVLQSVGYYVAMCGDGANDCGALKAAHSGISLSEAEASIASPFTSKIANISCVTQLIKEGRAALVTSFGVFKFIAGYSLTQFASVLLLYYIGANLTDFEFLYIDLVIITSLSITFPFTPPADKLHCRGPPVKLASFFPIFIIILNFIIMGLVQFGCILMIMAQPWFTPYKENEEEDYKSFENTAVFNVSCFQYTILAVMFAEGAPFRKNMLHNIPFLVNVILAALVAIWLIVYPTDPVAEFMELLLPPDIGFRAYFIPIGIGNFIICMLVEKLLTGNETVRLLVEEKSAGFCACCRPGSKYEAIEDEMAAADKWPKVQATNEPFADILHREMTGIE